MQWLLCMFLLVQCRRYAILLNTSIRYTNYRHSTNIQLFNNVLRSCQYNPDRIVMASWKDEIQNERNPFSGRIYLNRNTNTKYTPVPPTPLSTDYVINTLMGRHHQLKEMNENDTLLVYLCGHGRETFLKICDRDCLFRDDLSRIIRCLSDRLGKVLLILDTCEAESVINRNSIPENVFVVSTSLSNEPAYAAKKEPRLGVGPVDMFAYEFSRLNLSKDIPLQELFARISREKIFSSVTACRGKQHFSTRDFFESAEDPDEETAPQPFRI